MGILDINNPASPSLVGWFDTPGTAYQSRCYNNKIFVADGTAGLRILNFAEPDSIYEIGYLNSYHNALSIFINDTIAFLADDGDGVYLLDVRITGVKEEKRNLLPIMFNVFPSLGALFTIDFTLLGKNPICLVIYDCSGRKIKTLFNGVMPEGNYRLYWDGSEELNRKVYILSHCGRIIQG